MRRWSPVLPSLAALLLVAATARAADPIFDQGVLHEVRIVMDPADWRALRDNFRTNQYYAANVSFDGAVVEQVGIRSRGKGSRSAEKPSIKIDFNKYVDSQTFHGYGAVHVKNAVQDASFVREVLALSVYEALGIPAPQISFARLTVNDQYWGLYNLVEDVKKKFLTDRYSRTAATSSNTSTPRCGTSPPRATRSSSTSPCRSRPRPTRPISTGPASSRS